MLALQSHAINNLLVSRRTNYHASCGITSQSVNQSFNVAVIDIVVDLVVSLGDWMHIAEEVILLLLKNATRYKITVTTITVNSYHINHAHRMNCLIQLLETGVTVSFRKIIYFSSRLRYVDEY